MILSLINSKKCLDILGVFMLFSILTLYFWKNYYYKLFNFYDMMKKSVMFKFCIFLLSLAFLYLGLEVDMMNISLCMLMYYSIKSSQDKLMPMLKLGFIMVFWSLIFMFISMFCYMVC